MTDVKMSTEAANKVKTRFSRLAGEFDNSTVSLSVYSSEMLQAAGEFSDSMSDGAGTFELSWRDSFQVCRTASSLISGNTNQFHIDLNRLDEDNNDVILL